MWEHLIIFLKARNEGKPMCDNHMNIKFTCYRELSEYEKQVIKKMCSVDFQGREIILEQFETAKVSGQCTCGCKSILIEVDHNCQKYMYPLRVPIEMYSNDKDGVPIIYLLHVINGYINELEIFRADSFPMCDVSSLNNANIVINSY